MGNVSNVIHLIKKGADVNMQNKAGESALHHAVANNHTNVVRVLLERSKDPSLLINKVLLKSHHIILLFSRAVSTLERGDAAGLGQEE